MSKYSVVLMAFVFFMGTTLDVLAQGWSVVPNAGIPGHNKEIRTGITVHEAKGHCKRKGYKSFDYERAKSKAYFQDVNMYEVRLRTDYPGNPYDHYTYESKFQGIEWIMIPKAAISGHNVEIIDNITISEAQKHCLNKAYRSFDYKRDEKKAYFQDVNKDQVRLNRSGDAAPFNHYYWRHFKR